MGRQLRFGIIGAGNIAEQFCAGVIESSRGTLVAVGSRDAHKAATFAAKFQIPGAYGSYEAVLADPAVDAAYIALPNSMHHQWTIAALRMGKHVLCEKPFAIDAHQAEEMFDEAKKHGRVLIEAFMYRSHPLTLAVLDVARSGAIGSLQLIRSSFCYRTRRVAGNIRFSRELAGGALMDIGCYCIDFSRLLAGTEPTAVTAAAKLHETGVDEIAVGTLSFPGGLLASFTCGMTVQADNTAYICGDEGYIEIPIPWKPPINGAVYTIAHSIPPRQEKSAQSGVSQPRETRTVSGGLNLNAFEADDFAATVQDGAPPRISPQDTLANMRILDEMHRQIGMHL